jgi:hypothetical protein
VALAEIDLETAGAYLDEALAVAWELGSPLGSDDWTQGLPWDALARPGWETAQDCFKRCVQFVREMGSPDILILMLEALGHRARAEGDHEAARRFFQASLIKRRALGDPYGLAQSLEQFAVLAGREQQAGYRVPAQRVDEAWVGAIRLLGAAEALCETLGERPPVTDPTEYERTLTEGRAALGEATFAAAWEEGRALPPGQAVEAALGEA